MKIVFFGTPWFAAHILDYLIQQGVVPCAIVTKEDKAIGRSSKLVPPPVKQVALEKALAVPILQPSKASSEEVEKILAEYDADLFVVVAYGEILRTNVLSLPKKGCINVHASLLPLLRGASPIQQSIIEGHAKTGVTIMEMVLKMDAGDIIRTAEVPIAEQTTAGELESALCEASCPLLLEVIKDFEKGNISKTPQNHEEATYVKKILQTDCIIDWSKPAKTIHNLVRGLQPRPGAWCEITLNNAQKRLKIHKTTVVDRQGSPGELLEYSKKEILIAAGQDAVGVELLQLEGKKIMTAAEFTSGISEFKILT